jgi:hypothetical protein
LKPDVIDTIGREEHVGYLSEDVYDNREKIATFLQSDGFFEIT